MPSEPLLQGQQGEADVRTPLVDDDGVERLNDYMDNVVRLGFIRKVYSIVVCQLILTVLLALPFHRFPALSMFVRENPILLWIAVGLGLVFTCILTCNPECARTYPNNYILLGAFTVTQGFLIGVITALHSTHAALVAAGVTAILFFLLTLYAFNTKADFTGWGIYGLVATVMLLLVGLAAIITGLPVLMSIWLYLGVLLFCFYIVYDTQLIIGGKHHQYSFTVDDFVLASLCLYLDLINLFLHLLSIMDGD